jgi:hypothetical protein
MDVCDMDDAYFNRLKRTGFNDKNGYFYDGDLRVYRDESDLLTWIHADDFNEDEANKYYNINGIPKPISDEKEQMTTSGGETPGSQEMTYGRTPREHRETMITETINENPGITNTDLFKLLEKQEIEEESGLNDKDDDKIYGITKPYMKTVIGTIQKTVRRGTRKRKATKSASKDKSVSKDKSASKDKRKTKRVKTTKKAKTTIKAKTTTKTAKKRKNCDFNAFELIVALILKYDCKNHTDIYTKLATPDVVASDIGINKTTLENFIIDLNTRAVKKVNSYIKTFHAKNKEQINLANIKNVYLSGKGGEKNEKSDILFTMKNDTHQYGISVKQTKDATLSNFSVNVILKSLGVDTVQLDKIKQVLIAKTQCKKVPCEISNKEHRPLIGKILHNKNNDYWDRLRKIMAVPKINNAISNSILQSVLCVNTKTIVYEFDGSELNLFVPSCPKGGLMSGAKIVEDLPYYTLKSGKPRRAAKLFYRIFVGDKLKYRCEIRHKGSFTASPQFMLFKI